jgi:sulfide:quinone oxidoreductase
MALFFASFTTGEQADSALELRKLNESLSVSPEIALEDIPWLVANGYRTLISNRPDGEEPGQLNAADIANASRASGISFVHIPVVSGSISDDDVGKFSRAAQERSGKVHAFCRTGTRAAMLWALAEPSSRNTREILEAAAKAGYDISALRPRLEQGSRSPVT